MMRKWSGASFVRLSVCLPRATEQHQVHLVQTGASGPFQHVQMYPHCAYCSFLKRTYIVWTIVVLHFVFLLYLSLYYTYTATRRHLVYLMTKYDCRKMIYFEERHTATYCTGEGTTTNSTFTFRFTVNVITKCTIYDSPIIHIVDSL